MEPSKYIWKNGELIPWENANTHVLTHTLHYGGGVFEGIRCYKGAIFRLKDHMDRLLYSAKALKMNVALSSKDLCEAALATIRANELEEAYIRPLIYFGYGKMGLNPTGAPVEIIIAAWKWGKYLDHDMVDAKISDYIRIHPKSTINDAKICGHYVNSMLAVLALQDTKYHEAVFLDYEGNLAEGPGENIFFVKNGKIITPSARNILPGITRDTIKILAKDMDIELEERQIDLTEALEMDEAFFSGTAAEITGIRSLNDKIYKNGEMGEITSLMKNAFLQLVNGQHKLSASMLDLWKL